MVYSSKSGRWPGSLQPAGERMRATLTRCSPLLARPVNSSISLGGRPAASTRTGASISSGIGARLSQPRVCARSLPGSVLAMRVLALADEPPHAPVADLVAAVEPELILLLGDLEPAWTEG